jgi:hypothetical protein
MVFQIWYWDSSPRGRLWISMKLQMIRVRSTFKRREGYIEESGPNWKSYRLNNNFDVKKYHSQNFLKT